MLLPLTTSKAKPTKKTTKSNVKPTKQHKPSKSNPATAASACQQTKCPKESIACEKQKADVTEETKKMLADPGISMDKKKAAMVKILRSLVDSKATTAMMRCSANKCNAEMFEVYKYLAVQLGLPQPQAPIKYSDMLALNKVMVELVIKNL
jgi:hypothetical protein